MAEPPAMALGPFGGLWFRSADREAAFCEDYARSHFQLVDGVFRPLSLLVAVAFGWGRVANDLRDGSLSQRGCAALAVAFVAFALDLHWLATSPEVRRRRRTGLALAKRVVVSLLPAVLAPMMFRDPVGGALSMARFTFMNTGVFSLLAPSIMCPLLAKHHLALQVPTVAILVFSTPRLACTQAMITPQGAQYIVAAWRWLAALCTGAAIRMPAPEPEECCRDLVVVSLLVVGLWLPSYAVWAVECRARFKFDPRASRPLTLGTAAVHWMLLATGVSCVWSLMHPGAWQ
ncbi:unnamed protein product [Ostreobium quekettii]|uniref:Uncharacterized protein n=1 Tax=Ostreobium quekettii TaxID=121088 RepID=A0A8S1JBD5_9CHLO|nr:unnamed protein product [Ostreobium quekettii]|eukprot:evm.model.scf_2059.1 EVM.evm.TU.scf_2059.1   scf_2059:10191-11057(-)